MLTDEDHRFIHLAMRRGQVVVERGERRTLATLVAWRPSRNGKRTKIARVQFPSGTHASVPIDKVTACEQEMA